jgi:hydroxymethylbilane synthase
MENIIIGSRGSDLALWQARFVQLELRRIGIESTIEIISTRGDEIQHLSFDKMEGKGFFTKEIEEALLSKKIDLAVHSHKDLETTFPQGLTIAAVSYREDPSDILLIRKDSIDIREQFNLKYNAKVGTSSARRKSQLMAHRPDLDLADLRGNVPTRIQKLRDGNYDAIMLARAGVYRLEIDLSEFHVEILDPRVFIPAPAQGVLALQIRETDTALAEALKKISRPEVATTIHAEREILRKLEGGCQLPLGVYCKNENGMFKLWASHAPAWKNIPRRFYAEGESAEKLSEKVLSMINSPSKRSVFITRNLRLTDYFHRALSANGYTVKGCSLTRFQDVPFTGIPECDWIFFSSKNCVKYFFLQNPQLTGNIKIGTIGGATADALRKKGIKPDYIGQSNDTVEIGKEFAQMVSGQRVLFPQSTASFRTVQKQFSDQRSLTDLIVYDTIPDEEAEIPASDVVVFTSPTNAMLYLRKKKISANQIVIAIGKSTAEEIKNHGVASMMLPWNTSELAMADAVTSIH